MFRYDRPVAAPTAESAAMSGDRSQALSLEANLQNLIRLFWRRRVLIVVAALGCACLAVIVGKSLTPKYTATAQLYVDPRELQLVERELTPRAQDVSGLSIVAESQARLITSNSVLLRVIKNTQIDKDPEFGGKTAGWLGSLFARGTAPASDDTDALDALKSASKGVPNTLLRDIGAIHANSTFGDLPKELQAAISARIRFPIGEVAVVATHLGLSIHERHAQAQALAALVVAPKTLVIGDFNDWFWVKSVRRSLASRCPVRTRLRTFPSRLPLLRRVDASRARGVSVARNEGVRAAAGAELGALLPTDAPLSDDQRIAVAHLVVAGFPRHLRHRCR